MVKVQIDLSEKLNRKLLIVKNIRGDKSKQDALIDILEEYIAKTYEYLNKM